MESLINPLIFIGLAVLATFRLSMAVAGRTASKAPNRRRPGHAFRQRRRRHERQRHLILGQQSQQQRQRDSENYSTNNNGPTGGDCGGDGGGE